MASTSAFSSSAEAAIQRTVELNEAGTSLVTTPGTAEGDIARIYELDEVAHELRDRGFKTIALQFPDELLHDAVPVYRELKQRLPEDAQAYVLADTSYGSCCVDEVAAQHVDADVVVHFGHACLSRPFLAFSTSKSLAAGWQFWPISILPARLQHFIAHARLTGIVLADSALTSRLPVLYVFGRRALDAEHAISALLEACGSPPAHVKLLYDVAYAHAAETLRDAAQAALPNARIQWSPPPERFQPPGLDTDAAPAQQTADEGSVVFYVGADSLALSTVLMTHALTPAFSYDPEQRTARAESARTNGRLARRYALVHRARAADVFGIVVGTLGVAAYRPLIGHLRAALARAHKKTYTLAVGKLNPAKLANFPDVGAFVLVACPQTSLVDSRVRRTTQPPEDYGLLTWCGALQDYFAPVVTPFELLLALAPGEPAWTGDYALDFARLLAMPLPSPLGSDAEDDAPQYDFTSGKLRTARRFGAGQGEQQSDALVERSVENALSAVGAGFLRDRAFKGLEVNAGRDAPSVLEQGRSGIARGYDTVAEA